MEVEKSSINKVGLVIIVAIMLAGAFLVYSSRDSTTSEPNSDVVTTEGDKQMINLTAKGGYSPSVVSAKSNIETVLRVSTNNTFDCSSAFTIPKLGISKMLPATGTTEFTIAAQEPGSEINGTCSMGMYRFKIKFI